MTITLTREEAQQVLAVLDDLSPQHGRPDDAEDAIQTLRARLSQPEPKKAEIFAFLLGEGELDGVGFGDRHPTERGNYWWRKHLRAAITQPEPEPVAWMSVTRHIYHTRMDAVADGVQTVMPLYTAPPQQNESKPLCTAAMFDEAFLAKSGLCPNTPLYTAPPQREWQSLTDEECLQNPYCAGENDSEVIQLARAIEAKLKEKNS